jgi:hypothetical protein
MALRGGFLAPLTGAGLYSISPSDPPSPRPGPAEKPAVIIVFSRRETALSALPFSKEFQWGVGGGKVTGHPGPCRTLPHFASRPGKICATRPEYGQYIQMGSGLVLSNPDFRKRNSPYRFAAPPAYFTNRAGNPARQADYKTPITGGKRQKPCFFGSSMPMRDCGNDPARKPPFCAFIVGEQNFPKMRRGDHGAGIRNSDSCFSRSRRIGCPVSNKRKMGR